MESCRIYLNSLLNNNDDFVVNLEFLKTWNGCLELGFVIDVALVEKLDVWMKMNEVDGYLELNLKQFSWMNFDGKWMNMFETLNQFEPNVISRMNFQIISN